MGKVGGGAFAACLGAYGAAATLGKMCPFHRIAEL
jgi:hypothetical protein